MFLKAHVVNTSTNKHRFKSIKKNPKSDSVEPNNVRRKIQKTSILVVKIRLWMESLKSSPQNYVIFLIKSEYKDLQSRVIFLRIIENSNNSFLFFTPEIPCFLAYKTNSKAGISKTIRDRKQQMDLYKISEDVSKDL